jgi:hypothetical protein
MRRSKAPSPRPRSWKIHSNELRAIPWRNPSNLLFIFNPEPFHPGLIKTVTCSLPIDINRFK